RAEQSRAEQSRAEQSRAEPIETYYQSLKTSKTENSGIRFGQWCTSAWNKCPFRHSRCATSVLYKLRRIVYGKRDQQVGYGGSYKILEHEKEYKKLYDLLSDEKSRKTLMCILRYRITGDFELLHAESDFIFNQYFDKNIMQFTDSEVFVDCGGFVGDTTEMFISRIRNFSKIYLYEPEKGNYEKASHYLSTWEGEVFDKIVLRNAGVGKERASLKISSGGSGSHISQSGDQEVQITSLDDDINEPVTFIKMDIEGFELDALTGAKNHIIMEKPKLAICVYHKPDDLWQIPEYILQLNPSYKLYLRQYKAGDGNNAWESVLYAV
ncbi:MAG: FkbM family methyltransferase, partial [Methanocorpusculum sp.]|nr:FkbM family methyltransferase [Methanocorpusculum sp.]